MSTAFRVYRAAVANPAPAGDTAFRVYRAAVLNPVAQSTPVVTVAGGNRSVESGAPVSLDAVASVLSGNITSVLWVQATGPTVKVQGTGASVRFLAPVVAADVQLSFRCTATNGAGVTASATVVVTVWKSLLTLGSAPLVIRWGVGAPPKPTAAFTAPAGVVAGRSTLFVDRSTGDPIGWLWDFGDGTTSTAQNPTHTYATAGTYQVTLTAQNPSGSTQTTATVAAAAAGSTPAAPQAAVYDSALYDSAVYG